MGFEPDGVKADVIALAKGLAGGVPSAPCCAGPSCPKPYRPAATAPPSCNPLASAAALAVLDVIEKEKLLEAAQQRGAELGQRSGLVTEYPKLVLGSRGRGLLQAWCSKDDVDARAVLGRLQDPACS